MHKSKWSNPIVLPFLLLLVTAFTTQPTKTISWSALQEVDFEKKWVPEMNLHMLFPKFPPTLEKLNGTEVQVEGYVVPIDRNNKFIALSANPFAACFFCGKAGPASVMTIYFKTPGKAYKTDQYKTFSGKLKLNRSDYKQFYYILENAVEVTNSGH
jgi:hypothetical protein